jgi:tight adherence protein B
MEALSGLLPLIVFAAAGGIALAIYGAMTGNREVLKDRLAGYTQPVVPSEAAAPGSTGVLKEHKPSGVPLLGSLPGGDAYAEKVTSDLATAGLPLRLGEYLLIRWVFAMVLGLVPMLVGRPWILGAPLALVGYFLPRWYVGRRKSGRISTFNDQLCDALAMMSNALRSGSSFLQAIDLVAHELPPPIGEEFGIVVA